MALSVCTFDYGVTKEWKVCVRLSDAGFQEKYRYHMVFFLHRYCVLSLPTRRSKGALYGL